MRTLAALLIGLVILTACGQTGDLYLPDEEKTVVDEEDESA